MGDEAFWQAVDDLVVGSRLVIDRAKGTRHPRYPDFVYPLDYGYLEGTTTVDGGGVDVWRGSLSETEVVAVLCTIDLVKKDVEIKLLVGCTPEEVGLLHGLVNNDKYMRGTLIKR